MIAEIVGPSGRVHYRRPPGDPLVAEAEATPGYSVRFVETETVERTCHACGGDKVVRRTRQTRTGPRESERKCPACKGRGWTSSRG
jgi:DNA-directed RNA polymerase subunit M/transcription elongation factor TFIIS